MTRELDKAVAQGVFELIQEGDSLLVDGKVRDAAIAYGRAISTDPSNKLAYTKRASANSALGNLHAAIRDYSRVLEHEPTSQTARLQRGQLSLRICRFSDAEEDFSHILITKPDLEAALQGKEKVMVGRDHLETAESLLNSEDYTGAKQAISRLMTLANECVPARLLSAKIQFKEEDFAKCSWETGRILKIEPSNVNALLIRGEAHYHLAEFDTAKRHFGEVITNFDPDNQEAMRLFKKTKSLVKELEQTREKISKSRWKSAEDLIGRIMDKLAPSHLTIKKEMMIALTQARVNLDRSAASIMKAVEMAEELLDGEVHQEVVIARAEALLKQEKFEEAERYMTKLVQNELSGSMDNRLWSTYNRVKAALKKSKMKDYYKILGVSRDLDEASLKRAYRKMALKYHPDKVDGDKEEAEARFAEINEAYEVLSDPHKRELFEAGEDPFNGQPQDHNFGGAGTQYVRFQWGGGSFF